MLGNHQFMNIIKEIVVVSKKDRLLLKNNVRRYSVSKTA